MTETPTMKIPKLDTEAFSYKFLAPHALCASLIGSKGANIQQLQTMTQTNIRISDIHTIYPGTTSRIASVVGESVENLSASLAAVMEHFEGIILKEEPRENFQMIVPRRMRGAIIGAGGNLVSQLRERTGCRVNLKDGRDNECVVAIEGDAIGIRECGLFVIEKTNDPEVVGYVPPTVERRSSRKMQSHIEESHHKPPPMPTKPVVRPERDGFRGEPQLSREGRMSELQKLVGSFEREHEDGERCQLHIPLPNEARGAVIGKGGSSVKQIMRDTGLSHLKIVDDEYDGQTRSVANLEGSATACAAAYFLIMMRAKSKENRIAPNRLPPGKN